MDAVDEAASQEGDSGEDEDDSEEEDGQKDEADNMTVTWGEDVKYDADFDMEEEMNM